MPDVELRGVSLGFGAGAARMTALSAVDLALGPGAFTVISGPSGSGKTSLISVLGAMIAPDSGAVLFEGSDITKLAPERRSTFRREKIGYIFQSFRLMPALDAEENIRLSLEIRRVDNTRQRALHALEIVGVHAAFTIAAATSHALFLRGLVAAHRRDHRHKVAEELRRQRQSARDYRLIAAVLGAESRSPRDRRVEERMLAAGSAEIISSSVYYILQLLKRALDVQTAIPALEGTESLTWSFAPLVVDSEERYFEADGTTIGNETSVRFTYDGLGNVLEQLDEGELETDADDVRTVIDYSDCVISSSEVDHLSDFRWNRVPRVRWRNVFDVDVPLKVIGAPILWWTGADGLAPVADIDLAIARLDSDGGLLEDVFVETYPKPTASPTNETLPISLPQLRTALAPGESLVFSARLRAPDGLTTWLALVDPITLIVDCD